MNCVYIIYSESLDKYYIGEAIDLEERIEQHNSGFYETDILENQKIGFYIIV